MQGLLTVDVEDWFNSSSFRKTIPPSRWDEQESRIEKGMDFILDELEKFQIKGTFFCLGYSARRNPKMIRELARRGHDIASHGFYHDCVYDLSPENFRKDLRETRMLLEDLSGQAVIGYRAPNFSITDFAIEILQEESYRYDSSLYAFGIHDKYGKPRNLKKGDLPYEISSGFWEFPMSSLKIAGLTLPWSGGGYFRLFPKKIFQFGIKKISRSTPFNFYIHPWEFDPQQPRVETLDSFTRFRHYNNLDKTRDRFTEMLKLGKFTSIRDYLDKLT